MISATYRRPSLSPRTLQLLVIGAMILILSWPALSGLMQTYASQLTFYVMPAVMATLALVVLLQQWQLHRLATKVNQVTTITQQASAIEEISLPATQLTHFDADQFFFRGQTKH